MLDHRIGGVAFPAVIGGTSVVKGVKLARTFEWNSTLYRVQKPWDTEKVCENPAMKIIGEGYIAISFCGGYSLRVAKWPKGCLISRRLVLSIKFKKHKKILSFIKKMIDKY